MRSFSFTYRLDVLIFGANSHNDYNWLNVFSTNVNNTPPDATGTLILMNNLREI